MVDIRPLRTKLTREDVMKLSKALLEEDLLYTSAGKGIIHEMEESYAYHFGRRYAISTPNGTSALEDSINALGLTERDSFLVPMYAYPSGIQCLKSAGLEIIPVDIEKESLNINPEKIRKSLKPNTKGLLVVNMTGIPGFYREIMDISKKYGLYVIEDASRSVGAIRDGIESIVGFGDISCISLSNYKILAAGEGGVLLTNNEVLNDGAILYGQTLNPNLVLNDSKEKFGKNFSRKHKIHPVGAFLALLSLRKLEKRLKTTNRNFGYANQELGEFSFLTPLNISPDNRRGGWNGWFAFYNPSKNGDLRLDEFIKKLRRGGCSIITEYSSNFHEDLENSSFSVAREIRDKLICFEGVCSYQKTAKEKINQFKRIIKETKNEK